MKRNYKMILLATVTVAVTFLYLFYQIGAHWDYILPLRGRKVLAIGFTGSTIAFSTVIFQTVVNNRILTPAIIGLDSLYLLIQTVIVYFTGATTLTLMNKQLHFILSVSLMVLFSILLYKLLFQKENRNIFYLLLMGIIFGTFFKNLASFMQMLIDPNEFQVVQNRMFASLNNVNIDLLFLASIAALVLLYFFRNQIRYLDVLSLGRDQAINLGVDYDQVVKRLLILVATFTAGATALVGPITFLGLLVANTSYQFFQTHRHLYLIPGAILISLIALIGGQFFVERVFQFNTTLSVVINFLGGIYFIYLLLKEAQL